MNWILEKAHENGTVMYLVFSTDVKSFYLFFLVLLCEFTKGNVFVYFNHPLHICQLKQTPQ